jgi:hypothetical protein
VSAPQILIARTGPRDGLVIAAMPGKDPYTSGTRLVVGSVYRTSPDDKPVNQPGNWRAWLWPAAGGAMHVTQSCEAIDAATTEKLLERLRKRAGHGPWWGGEAS